MDDEDEIGKMELPCSECGDEYEATKMLYVGTGQVCPICSYDVE